MSGRSINRTEQSHIENDSQIAIIGYGALARFIINAIGDGAAIRITHVLVRPDRVPEVKQLLPSGIRAISALDEIHTRPALILELASHSAVAKFVAEAVNEGLDTLIASTGALADDALRHSLTENARRTGSQVHLLPGAIGALDVLSAHREAGLNRVSYVGRKAPLAWKGTPAARQVDLKELKTEITIFEGTAREAVRLYPKNANVAATVALSGIGFEDTSVQLIADPHATATVHNIIAESNIGRFNVELIGKPLAENPKTSALTAYSALRFLHNLYRPIVT